MKANTILISVLFVGLSSISAFQTDADPQEIRNIDLIAETKDIQAAGVVNSDLDLARENKYIDLIIGGHTHTFLKAPVWLKSKFKKSTLINQVGWAGIELGKIDFHIHKLSGESELYGRNLIVNSLV